MELNELRNVKNNKIKELLDLTLLTAYMLGYTKSSLKLGDADSIILNNCDFNKQFRIFIKNNSLLVVVLYNINGSREQIYCERVYSVEEQEQVIKKMQSYL